MKTEVRFTHMGLVPQCECYGNCSNGWGLLINGDLLKAEGKLDQALELYQQTRDILQKLVEQDPSNGRWQANLARAYLRLGRSFPAKGSAGRGAGNAGSRPGTSNAFAKRASA